LISLAIHLAFKGVLVGGSNLTRSSQTHSKGNIRIGPDVWRALLQLQWWVAPHRRLRRSVLGLTFNENVPEIRNSKVPDIVSELQSFGVAVQVHDPIARAEEAIHEYGIKLVEAKSLAPADAVILAVAHHDYVSGGWGFVTSLLKREQGIVLDVKSKLERAAKPRGVELWRL
jgi:UDP-N-acetyl-D-mannosaminuronate dehydrogenase